MQVLLLAVFATANLAVSTTTELDWSDHYANAKTQAAAEHRPLLVVLENSADPAGRFDQSALVDEGREVELLKHYRLCRMDINTPYGKRVAEAAIRHCKTGIELNRVLQGIDRQAVFAARQMNTTDREVTVCILVVQFYRSLGSSKGFVHSRLVRCRIEVQHAESFAGRYRAVRGRSTWSRHGRPGGARRT